MNWQIDWQLAGATLLVAGCALYALWPLLPARWRQRWRTALGLAPRAGGSGCSNCDGGCAPPRTRADGGRQPADPVIHVVRRPPG